MHASDAFQADAQHWSSEGVSLSKLVHGPFEKNCLNSSSPLSPSASIPVVFFYRQELGGLLLLALEPE